MGRETWLIGELQRIRNIADAGTKYRSLHNLVVQNNLVSSQPDYDELEYAINLDRYIDTLSADLQTTLRAHVPPGYMDETREKLKNPQGFVDYLHYNVNTQPYGVTVRQGDYGYELIAQKDLPKGTILPYTGITISDSLSKRLPHERYNKQIGHLSGEGIKRAIAGEVYPRNAPNVAGFANDLDYYEAQEVGTGKKVHHRKKYRPTSESKNNAQLVSTDEGAYAQLHRDVREGEEIGIRYGASYWDLSANYDKNL